MFGTVLRPATAALAAAFAMVLAVGMALPASASSMWFYRDSGRFASASWLEVGTLPGGVPGNIHFGTLYVEDLGNGNANVFGDVLDLTCEPGVIPDRPGGGHGEEVGTLEGEEPQAPEGCEFAGGRFIDGGNVTFRMDRRLSSATLTGTLNVFGHDGPSGSPGVNMTFNGVSDTYKSVVTESFTDGTSTYTSRYTFTGRDGNVSGNIGAMIFDNVAGEWSESRMGSFRSVERGRSR